MTRTRNPKETRKLILNTAMELFVRNGYENTSLQDIIENLDGLTKGAIYHHFKSKDDILYAAVDMLCNEKLELITTIRDDATLTGKEKLELMFQESTTDTNQDILFGITPKLIDNPTFLVYYMKSVLYSIVPNFVAPVIHQGVKDGSITTAYPDELAEMLMLLSDIWINPAVINITAESLTRKILLLNDIMSHFGLNLFNTKVQQSLEKFRTLAEKNNEIN